MLDEARPLYNDRASENPHWNAHMETMSRADLDALHLRRIRRNMEYAYRTNDFYHDLFRDAGVKPGDVTSLEEFNEKVPIIDKPDLMRLQEEVGDDPFDGRGHLGRDHDLYRFRTSGTTGVPLQETYSLPTTLKMGECWAYGFWRCGLRPQDRFYFAFSFGTYPGFWTAYFGVRQLGGTIRSGSGLSTEERIRDIVRFDPDAVVMTPTYATYVAETAEEMGVDLRETSVRYVVVGGEKGAFVPAVRDRIETAWGAGVWEMYGQSESPFQAVTMDPDPAGVHCCEPYFYSTVVDPDTGERIEESGEQGEHIVTTHIPSVPGLTLRYRTHDLVELYEDPSEVVDTDVTWKFFRGGVLDRTDNMVTIRGTNFYPRALEELITGVEGATPNFELHIDRENGNDAVDVRIEAAASMDAGEYGDVEQRLRAAVKDAIGVTLDYEVVAPRTLDRYELKAKRVFDHRQ